MIPSLWDAGWRERSWPRLEDPWDLIVIGGGITGAGIFLEAARSGLRVLLVEAQDFASGTSSRSSKLVHGGLRYLRRGQLRLTRQSVQQRERLLSQAEGLVEPLKFLFPLFAGGWQSLALLGIGLSMFDLLALRWDHRRHSPEELLHLCPELKGTRLQGGYSYRDAGVDDARLVLRVLRASSRLGGEALNYARVTRLLRNARGRVVGIGLRDESPGSGGREAEVLGSVVINATGAWADELRGELGARARLRRLRGAHLVLAAERLPLRFAVTVLHPVDERPLFAIPWEGVTIFGTTDIDHELSMWEEPRISPGEAGYLMEALRHAFPGLELTDADIQATFAGVRPVVDTGKANPSQESREHVLWHENGLLTVTGGKLTTFHLMAREALEAARAGLSRPFRHVGAGELFPSVPGDILSSEALDPAFRRRLLGRYGVEAADLLVRSRPGDLEPIEGLPAPWAEVRWAAQAEGVIHLDDLLLRRTRLGLLLPEGGLAAIDRIRSIAQPELGWDDARWEQEVEAYAQLWRAYYHRPA